MANHRRIDVATGVRRANDMVKLGFPARVDETCLAICGPKPAVEDASANFRTRPLRLMRVARSNAPHASCSLSCRLGPIAATGCRRYRLYQIFTICS